MQYSVIGLDCRYVLLHLKNINCYSFYFEGKACSVHGSKDDAIKAAYKHSVIVD